MHTFSVLSRPLSSARLRECFHPFSLTGSTDRRPRTTIHGMRGDDREPNSMFSYVSTEQRIPREHPLQAIRTLVEGVLRDMSREFDRLYAAIGRPSVPPERLLRAQL